MAQTKEEVVSIPARRLSEIRQNLFVIASTVRLLRATMQNFTDGPIDYAGKEGERAASTLLHDLSNMMEPIEAIVETTTDLTDLLGVANG